MMPAQGPMLSQGPKSYSFDTENEFAITGVDIVV